MTRADICKNCEQFTGESCRKITCCGKPDMPSPTAYRRRLTSHHGRCPMGKWVGSDPMPLPVLTNGTTFKARFLAGCSVCDKLENGLCTVAGVSAMKILKDPAASCPLGLFSIATVPPTNTIQAE